MLPSLSGAPEEDRLQYLPVGSEFLQENFKRARFLFIHKRLIFLQCCIHIVAALKETGSMNFRFLAVGLEQVVANICAREVKVGADLLQDSCAREEVLANVVIALLDVTNRLDT